MGPKAVILREGVGIENPDEVITPANGDETAVG
jgi:hypothetical protein